MIGLKFDSLNNLRIGEVGMIVDNLVEGFNRQNVINLGFTKGALVKCLYFSPFKDPVAYLVKDVVVALRGEDSKNIIVMRDICGTY